MSSFEINARRMSIRNVVEVCLWAFFICYAVLGPTSAPPSDPRLTPLSIDELCEIAHARRLGKPER